MKNKKPKHTKTGISEVKKTKDRNNKNIHKTEHWALPSTLSIGTTSVICISIIIAFNSEILSRFFRNTDIYGGWRIASNTTIKKYGSDKCTITRKNAKFITSQSFEKEYRFKKPLIVYFDEGASGWTEQEKWSVESLKKEYGDWLVHSGNSLEIVRRGGSGDLKSSFTEFADQLIRSTDDLGEPLLV